MNTLTVLFDARCPFCVRCRDWLASEAWIVPLRFVDANSAEAQNWARGVPELGGELVVADDHGRVWVGPEAFIVCLWALAKYQSLAFTLAGDVWPLTRVFFQWLSSNRGLVGTLIAPFVRDLPPCEGHCARSPIAGVYR